MDHKDHSTKKIFFGICYIHVETGIEGVIWAFQAARHIHKNVWDSAGMYFLENGDELVIYDPKDLDKIVWHGVIHYNSISRNELGYRCRKNQKGVSHKRWVRWFKEEYPALLITGHK